MEGIIKAVCISEKRGTVKKNINEVKVIKDFGLEGDAHAGKWPTGQFFKCGYRR